MSVTTDFTDFCNNLRMSDDTVGKIGYRCGQITRRINADYRSLVSETAYSFFVGSYGRGTEIHTSDIDMMVELPYEVFARFNAYSSNGQSALLQEVKEVIKRTYSSSFVKGDGQVVGIDFSDNISFEIVPVFKNNDGTYTYPDSNGGGLWRVTNPKKEIEAMNQRNADTNKNLKRLCRMARAWKDNCNVPISGILIDTLAKYEWREIYGSKYPG